MQTNRGLSMVTRKRKAEEIGVGVSVYHQKFGTGTVVERWGSLVIKPEGKGKAVFAPCNDVFDVIFGKVIHCCRREFLRPTEPQNIMMADSGGGLAHLPESHSVPRLQT
jgi:hypothetical protein